MKRWLLRIVTIVGMWMLGGWIAVKGAAYSSTHPRIERAKGLDVLSNMWRDFVASTTGINSAVLFLVLVAATLVILFVTKKKRE